MPTPINDQSSDSCLRIEGSPSTAAFLVPPPEGKCPICAAEHEPFLPHNQQSLYYLYRFHAVHRRWPTWADAAAHCSDRVRESWQRIMRESGYEWTEPPAGESPIADPPGESIREAVEMEWLTQLVTIETGDQ